MDNPEHSGYDIFPNSASNGSFSSSRYRTNASSSSSLGHPSYGVSSDGLYPHPPFNDAVNSFNGSNVNPYDMMNGMSSSYSSGKVSPLTPSDPVGGLHGPTGFPPVGGKDFPGFSDVGDRRLPSVATNGYQSDFPEDYAMGNMNNNGLSFPSSQLQPFQERVGRFSDGRFPSSTPNVPPHLQHSHSSDIMRGVNPHATTHSFRDAPVSGYDEIPSYLHPNPHSDMGIRIPTVDDPLSRMKLQGHPIMGTSNDLQTFIRCVRSVELDPTYSEIE